MNSPDVDMPAVKLDVDVIVSLVQFSASPMNPSGQTQAYEPNEFLQIVFGVSQIVEFISHSSISMHVPPDDFVPSKHNTLQLNPSPSNPSSQMHP